MPDPPGGGAGAPAGAGLRERGPSSGEGGWGLGPVEPRGRRLVRGLSVPGWGQVGAARDHDKVGIPSLSRSAYAASSSAT